MITVFTLTFTIQRGPVGNHSQCPVYLPGLGHAHISRAIISYSFFEFQFSVQGTIVPIREKAFFGGSLSSFGAGVDTNQFCPLLIFWKVSPRQPPIHR